MNTTGTAVAIVSDEATNQRAQGLINNLRPVGGDPIFDWMADVLGEALDLARDLRDGARVAVPIVVAIVTSNTLLIGTGFLEKLMSKRQGSS